MLCLFFSQPQQIEASRGDNAALAEPSFRVPSSHPTSTSSSNQTATTQQPSSAQILLTQRLSSPVPPPLSAQRSPQSSESQAQRNRRNTPTRRRRRRRPALSAADAREQLVSASQTRAQAELANSRSLERAVSIFGEMLSIMRRIEAK